MTGSDGDGSAGAANPTAARSPSDARLDVLLERIDVGLWDWCLATGEFYASPTWLAAFGEGSGAASNWLIWLRRRARPAELAGIEAAFGELLAGERERARLEYRIRRPDGGWSDVVTQARVVERAPDGQARRVIGTDEDVTDARVAEAIRKLDSRLRETLDELPIAVALVDADGTAIHHNLACERLTGLPRSAMRGINNAALPWAVFDESGRRVAFPEHNVFAPWLTGQEVRGVVLAHFPVGADEPVWTISDFVPHFERDGQLRHVMCSFADITVLRRIKASLARTHRFEGLAHLAGAVAHDFNNVLATVLGSAEVVGINLPDDSEVRDDLDRIVEAAQRGAALTHQLVTYARRQPGLPRVVDLCARLEAQTETLQRLLGRRVGLEVKTPSEPLHVVIDPSQFEQLVSSLIVNAKEAMPQGGQVVVELDVALHLTSADGRPMVVLRVIDNGEGIPADVLPHVFDPMFTTRHLDMGAGLGLATCDGIVRQHGGRIAVSSRRGQGTTFEVSLPRAHHLPRDDAPPPTGPPLARTGELLLAETDPTLRDMARLALERSGYRVLAARDGAEAEALAAASKGLVGLIVADELPDTDGATLADRLADQHPRLAVLIVRNSDNPAPAIGSLRAGSGFIFRPFGTSELMSRFEALLGTLR